MEILFYAVVFLRFASSVMQPHNFAFAFAPFSYKTLRKKICLAEALLHNEPNDEWSVARNDAQ